MTHRILHLIPTLDRGGAEKQLAWLATHLPRDDFDVHVAVLTRSGPWRECLEQAGIPVHDIRKRWKVDPLAYRKLARLLKHLRPDILHTWIFAANAYGRMAGRHAKVPHLVAAERCVDQWKVWHELAIDRYLARRTDSIVTNSSGVVAFYEHQNIPAHQFTVIPNAVEVPSEKAYHAARHGELYQKRAELLAEYELPENAQLIGAIGRLWPQKRYKDLIWAAELLKVIRPDSHLLIIGDGPQRMELLRWRDNLDIADRVHFLGHRNDVDQLLPHLAVFWIGSGYEGQSNAVLEAMSWGLPIVASDIPGNRDLVVDQQTGYFFEVGDRAGLARVTNQLLDDPDLARSLGEAGRQRVASEFSLKQMVDRHVALYRRLLES